jgi:DNA polymerase-3 subunit epsilon
LSLRLFPRLPRKSLRAIAGYFGHSVPELRRSSHHIAATAFIWHHLVRLLAEKNIYSLRELKEWLKNTTVRNSGDSREYLMEASQRLNLPKKPGIYRMSRSNGDLLYIGKATSLKHRVNSYFQKGKRTSHANHIMEMLTQAAHLEVIVTGSALEAALLEADLIKKFSPPYNIALRQRDREIVFFSRNLRESSPVVDEAHPLGPLPTGKSIPSFAAVDALLKEELTGMDDRDICSLVLGISREYAPETGCFWQGVDIFQQRHCQILEKYTGEFSIEGLMLLGKLIHQKKLLEAATEVPKSSEENNDETNETKEAKEHTWTPEGITDVMEGIIRHGAYLIRRSRWFCLMSEASLAWITGKTSGKTRRLLIFRGGKIDRQEEIALDDQVPSPPDLRKSFRARQQNFDLIIYDRLRVLTTELRRIVSDDTHRHVQLRLSPEIMLANQQLFKLLQWV